MSSSSPAAAGAAATATATDASAAASTSGATASEPSPLVRLAARAFLSGLPASASELAALPTDLVKLAWKELRAASKQQDRALRCKNIYPFVASCGRIDTLDLSDAARWITDASLGALASLPSLQNVRLTSCRFVSDAGLSFAPSLPQLQTLDVSWTAVGDVGLSESLSRCGASLTSLNLTGLAGVTDRGTSALLGLGRLERLSLASTSITDAALDYLTYYTRYPDAAPQPGYGVPSLRWLELSNTPLTEVGVGKLVAVHEDGKPYGKVFKQLEYLALSSTPGVPPSAVMQVKVKYGLDTPLPNAQRTLAKSNMVALDAQGWVMRLSPSADKSLPTPERSWEQDRVVGYVAQYTKEMAASVEVIRRLHQADSGEGPPMHTFVEAKRQRTS